MERLQKVIANSNVTSRRKAEQLIIEKRVKVNGVIITELGTKVNKNDLITIDDKPIKIASKKYLLLNKPTGYLSTTSDDKKRKTVMDLIKNEFKDERIYPVGRLDFDAAGLLILTNDGELTNKLTKDFSRLESEYIIRVKGIIIRKELIKIREGILLKNGIKLKPVEANIIELDKQNQTTLIRFVTEKTKNSEIKELFELLNHEVKNITRTRYDFLTIEGVKRGLYRELSVHEIKKLHSNQVKN